MTSLKHSFLLIAAIAAFSTLQAFGQGSSKATITANEANNMAAFYEWALEAQFSPGQRSQFVQFLEADVKAHPDNARTNIDTVLGTWEQIKQASEEVRRKTRAEFLRGYLPELKKSTDASDAFLLDIYRAAHGGRDTFTDLDEARFNVADKSDLNAASGDSPAQSLIGRWERNTGSGSITDGTGKTKYGNGKKFTFEFGPGGTVEYIVAEKTLSIMGCKIESTDQARGKYSISGGSMDIQLAAGTSVGTDSCDRSGNYRKSQPASSLTVAFKIKRSDDITRPDHPMLLCFDGGDGEACYEKVPG